MTLHMSHEEAQAALGALALEALSDIERRAVLAHVATCEECSAELAVLRDTVASLSFAAATSSAAGGEPGRADMTRARLLARAREDAASRGGAVAVTDSSQLPVTRTSHRAAPRVQRIPPTTWLALAAALAFVAALGGWLVSRAHVVQLESDLVAVRTLAASRLDSLNATLDALTASEVRVVNLTATGPRPPSAQMFWNQRSSRWTLFAHYLAPPAAGKTYQVWLVTTANEKISAGTFTPDSTGHATLQADYALAGGPASLQTVAVTLEPDGGVPQPTGPIILAGNATR